MHDKKGFTKRVEEFLNGKGFYIVLFVCVAVIGVSAWLLLFSEYSPLDLGDAQEDYLDVMADIDDVSAPIDLRDDGELESGDDTQPQSGTGTQDEEGGASTNQDSTGTPDAGALTVEPGNTQDEDNTQPQEDAGNTQEPQETVTEEPEPQVTADDLSFIWPLSGSISVEYSPDALIYDKTMGDWRTHDGIDIGAQIGTKVMAISDGTVTDISQDDMMGTTITIDHGAGVVSIYSNMASVPAVVVGDSVTMGSVIGSVGDTALAETSEVAHLHLSMTVDGESADPTDYLP